MEKQIENLEKAMALFKYLKNVSIPQHLQKEIKKEIATCKQKIEGLETPEALTPINPFLFDYKIKITRETNMKGTLEIFIKNRAELIELTERETDVIITMARKSKKDAKKKMDKDKGWTSVVEFKNEVKAWGMESTADDQIRTQVMNIRDKLEEISISREYIEKLETVGYRISTPAKNITIEK